jgi:hypothetical protein
MTKQSINIQEALFNKVKAQMADHLKLADELADILEISVDSAYRRIRGETTLSLEDIVTICNHYNLSFDSFLNPKVGSVTFSYNPLFSSEEDFERYLLNILGMLEKMAAFGGEITYAAEDVPVIRSLSYPNLAQFKIYYWLKSVLNDTSIRHDQFELGLLPEKYNVICENIRTTYNKVNSIEIWTEETLYSTLKQIEFYWQTGMFKKQSEAIKVWDDMHQVVKDLKFAAEHESKNPEDPKGASFKLYDCEVLVGNNCIILKAGEWQRTFISYNSMNSLNTEDKAFNQEAVQWMQNLMRKSAKLSGIGERQRFRFFKKMEEKLQNTLDILSRDPF